MTLDREQVRKENLKAFSRLKEDGTTEIFELLRKYLEHEDNLVNQRTTWFLQLNSFLFASVALIFSSEATPEVLDAKASTLFVRLICLVGATSSVVTLLGVWAAYASTKALKDVWVDKYEPRCKDLGISESHRKVDEFDFEAIKRTKFRNDPTRPLPYMKGGGGRYRIASKGRHVALTMPTVIGLSWASFLLISFL